MKENSFERNLVQNKITSVILKIEWTGLEGQERKLQMRLFTKNAKVINRVVSLPIDQIIPNPAQPRKVFELGDLECLATSILENGLLQPLTVRMNDSGEYELISGERRLKAAKLAKLQELPCIVMETDEKQSAIYALIENIQRQNLNFFEEAMAIKNLITDWGITQEEASKRLGKAQSTIANKLRLLRFTEKQQKKIMEAGLTERHARTLLKLDEDQMIDKAIYYIEQKNLNVKQTEQYIQTLIAEEKPSRTYIPVIKDVRIFFNTINRAVETMQRAGINAKTEQIKEEDFIQYIVKIPIGK